MTKSKYFFLIVILGALTALAPFSIDMYLPGFPAIAKDLHSDIAAVSLSLSSFFIGVSAGQLLYGPLLDRFGRKRPLHIGLLVYLLASLGCVFATSVEALIGLRFLQALGCCAATVAATAMVRDLFPVEENAKVFSLLLLVVGASPMLAPAVGGYVTAYLGWHYIFIILTALAVLILAGAFWGLPESSAPDPHYSLLPGPITRSFLAVVREPRFTTYAFTGAIAFAGLLTYVAGSPNVFLEIFKVSGTQYSLIFALLAAGLIGAGQVNSLLLKKYRSEQLITAALIFQTLIALVLVVGSTNGWLGFAGTLVLIFIFLSCAGFIFPNASALSMAPFSKNAGSASALMGALQMGLGALASVVVSVLSKLDHSTFPMTGVMAGCSLLALAILLTGSRIIRNRNARERAAGQELLCNLQ